MVLEGDCQSHRRRCLIDFVKDKTWQNTVNLWSDSAAKLHWTGCHVSGKRVVVPFGEMREPPGGPAQSVALWLREGQSFRLLKRQPPLSEGRGRQAWALLLLPHCLIRLEWRPGAKGYNGRLLSSPRQLPQTHCWQALLIIIRIVNPRTYTHTHVQSSSVDANRGREADTMAEISHCSPVQVRGGRGGQGQYTLLSNRVLQ